MKVNFVFLNEGMVFGSGMAAISSIFNLLSAGDDFFRIIINTGIYVRV